MTMSVQNSYVANVCEYGEETLERYVNGSEKAGTGKFYISIF